MNVEHWLWDVIFINCSCTGKMAWSWYSLMNIYHEYQSSTHSVFTLQHAKKTHSIALDGSIPLTLASLWSRQIILKQKHDVNSSKMIPMLFPISVWLLEYLRPVAFYLMICISECPMYFANVGPILIIAEHRARCVLALLVHINIWIIYIYMDIHNIHVLYDVGK